MSKLHKNRQLEKIVNENDASYFVEEEVIIGNYKKLIKSFQKYYKNTVIGYSYKTNYIPFVCKTFHKLGAYAETVSEMEGRLAEKLGVPFKKIYFNGPSKEYKWASYLLKKGGVFTIDSFADYKWLKKQPSKLTKKLRVGIRCNFLVQKNKISRFGIDTNSKEFKEIILDLSNDKNISEIGFHCHFAQRDLPTWKKTISGMMRVLNKYHSAVNKKISFVSLGGGLQGEMNKELQEMLGAKQIKFSEYAREIKPIAELLKTFNRKIILMIEPGTSVVADAMFYTTKVRSIKLIGNTKIATVMGSKFHLFGNAKSTNLPTKLFGMRRKKTNCKTIITGFTCVEGDVLNNNFNYHLEEGDIIKIESIGSYSVVMKPPFIKPNIPVYFISKAGKISNIKRAETFHDIFRTYSF